MVVHPAHLSLLAWLFAFFSYGAPAQEHPCSRPQEPFVIALCSDPELRALADRQMATMMAVWGRLSPEEQRRFRSEQLTWRETTARTCGVASSPISLPLPIAVKSCLKRAELAHTEFLRRYPDIPGGIAEPGYAGPPTALIPSPPIPPTVAQPTTVSPTTPATTTPSAGTRLSAQSSTLSAGAPATESDNRGGAEDSGFGPGLAVIGSLLLLGMAVKKLVKVVDRRRRTRLVCDYINEVNQTRYFPSVPVEINLRSGEVGLLQAEAKLSEMRSHRYSTGGSFRLAKGVRISSRQYHSYRTRDVVDHGTVVITSQRIAYIGSAKTAQVLYRDLVSIDGDLDTNVLHTARRQNAIVIHYPVAMLGLVLVRFFASTSLSGNRLPDGWQFTARPKGSGIAIDLREGEQARIAS